MPSTPNAGCMAGCGICDHPQGEAACPHLIVYEPPQICSQCRSPITGRTGCVKTGHGTYHPACHAEISGIIYTPPTQGK